jgi:hypothetical protein
MVNRLSGKCLMLANGSKNHASPVQYSLQAMEVALRVLTALTEKRNPHPADVNRLRTIVDGSSRDLPLDELACEVIQRALRHRAEARKKATG